MTVTAPFAGGPDAGGDAAPLPDGLGDPEPAAVVPGGEPPRPVSVPPPGEHPVTSSAPHPASATAARRLRRRAPGPS
ncbi:hypothetical protein JOF58_005556 [Streptomyces cinnamonensis]|nr:hypothetical protein [Streptomyces virginiae]